MSFRRSSKPFNTEGTEITERTEKETALAAPMPVQCKTGRRRADFLARNVWVGGLGRTKGAVGLDRASFAGNGEAEGPPNRSSRRDVRVLVFASPGIRDDRAKLYLSRDEGRNRPGGIRRRDGRVCRGEDANRGGRRVRLPRRSGHPREAAASFENRAAIPPRIPRRKHAVPIRCPGD